MSKKRGNLIDEIRARLGRMQLEKIRFIQQSPENQKLQKEENKVMHQLMEIQMEDCQNHLREEENDADIEGWRSNRICNLDQKLSNQRSKKRTFRNITNINSQSNYQRLHNPIPYLKDVLKRLQSPKPRREFKTETQTAGSGRKRDEKNKTQQSLFYTPQLGKERFKILSEKSKNRTISVVKKPERAKFQSLDKNGQNKPFPSTKPAKNISEYRKIKRKNSSQYEMDVAQEKIFLQQLMQGKRKSREHEDREKSKSHQRKISLNEKFTLKNLIY